MSPSELPSSSELLAEVRRIFGPIRRGSGVSLHQTVVLDDHGTRAEMARARQEDFDQRWWEVRDAWIEECADIGGPLFLDDEGFRYYLPAYLSYWLRRQEEPASIAFSLTPKSFANREQFFSREELIAIAKVVLTVTAGAEYASAFGRRLRAYWRAFVPASAGGGVF